MWAICKHFDNGVTCSEMHAGVFCVFPGERLNAQKKKKPLLSSWTRPSQGFKPSSRQKPASSAFIPLPGLICFNAVCYAGPTCHSRPPSPAHPDILFRVRLNLRPLWRSVCDVHSGNTKQVPLWSWLAVKTSSPFNCLLPRDITPHPLTLDITTPQRVFWNCGGEKTRRWCLSLFGKFLRNSFLSFTSRSHTVQCTISRVVLCQSYCIDYFGVFTLTKRALSFYVLAPQWFALFPTMPLGTLQGIGVNLLFAVKNGHCRGNKLWTVKGHTYTASI